MYQVRHIPGPDALTVFSPGWKKTMVFKIKICFFGFYGFMVFIARQHTDARY